MFDKPKNTRILLSIDEESNKILEQISREHGLIPATMARTLLMTHPLYKEKLGNKI